MMKHKAIIYVVLAGVLWGTSGIFVNLLSPYGFTSYQMTAVRACVSLLCMLIYALIKDRKLFRVKPIYLILLSGIGVSMFFSASLYYSSMQMTSVSTAVVLMYTAPIYVAVFSALFLGEKLTLTKIIAIGCMLVGCAFVSGIIGGLKFDAVGIILGALSGITYAAYNVMTKIAVQKGLHPISVTLYSFMLMAAIALFISEPEKMASSIRISPAMTIPLLIGLGIFTFVAPYFLYTLGMRDLLAATATSLGTVEPMSATLFSVMLFGEKLDIFSVLGIMLIVFAVFMIGRAERTIENTIKDKEYENAQHN